MAKEKKITRAFRDKYCILGGIQLLFNGAAGWKGQQACSQYVENFGCSVHQGRPLACRLYPLGRQIQSDTIHYMYEGTAFPCLEGCPEVEKLPYLSVGDYLDGQQTTLFEQAQDAYLEVMQNLADIAFVLLLDTGLAKSGDTKTLALWRKMGNEQPTQLAERIGNEWLDNLTLPEIENNCNNPLLFAQQHNELLQIKAQEQFGTLQTNETLHNASSLIMGVALLLASGIGANPSIMAEHWISIAKEHGAKE